MSTYSGLASMRDDFRCSLCRQKGVFHCEHDTPYRDQLLGIYDQEKPYIISSTTRRDPQPTRTSNNNNHTSDSKRTNNNSKSQNTNLGQNTTSTNKKAGHNLNVNSDGQYQQGRRPDDNLYSNTYSNPYANAYDYTEKNPTEKKEKSSCVIL